MGFQHMLMSNILNRDRYFDVQTGEVTLSGTTQTVTVTAFDTSKGVLEFSYTCASVNDDANRQMVMGRVNSSTQIEFLRYNATGDCVIRWWIWEARPSTPMTVYRYQEQVGSSASLPQSQTITSVNTSKSFALISYRADTTDPPKQNNVVRTKITGATSLECDMNLTNSASVECEIQVVEHTDWDVQTGDKTVSATTDSAALSPSIVEDEGYVASSGEFNQSVLDANEIYKVWQDSNTTINFARINASGIWIVTWYAADTNGDFYTQNENQVIPSGGTSQTATVNSTDTDKTFLKLSTPFLTHGVLNSGSPDADWLCVKLAFGGTPATQNTVSRISNFALATETKTARHEIIT